MDNWQITILNVNELSLELSDVIQNIYLDLLLHKDLTLIDIKGKEPFSVSLEEVAARMLNGEIILIGWRPYPRMMLMLNSRHKTIIPAYLLNYLGE